MSCYTISERTNLDNKDDADTRKPNQKEEGKMEQRLKIEKTKKGFPAYWEAGGGRTNIGNATIIAGIDGRAKEAIYVRRKGDLANAHHALVTLEVGDYIIETNHHREDFAIEIFRITGFEDKEGNTHAVIEQVNCFDKGEWDAELPAFLAAAVHAAMEKATCYHCREPHFVTLTDNR